MEEHRPKKLLDQVRDAIRLKHYSYRTEQAYVSWIKRHIYFHDVRQPSETGAPEVEAFLTHLAVKENVVASTQNPCAGRSEVRPSVPFSSSIMRCSTRTWARLTPCAPNARSGYPLS